MKNFITLAKSAVFGTKADLPENLPAFSEIPLETLEGEPLNLKNYCDHLLLFVNTASKCGFTKQYAGLQNLYERFKEQNFLIIGLPCNDFGNQEPGSSNEIQQFCELKFNVDFPVTKRITVLGKNRHPLYNYLLSNCGVQHEVKWNFEKFLVRGNGEVIKRYSSPIKPESQTMITDINKALSQT